MTKEKIDKLTSDEFEPYSHEWEKEMMKFTKPYLITWLRDSLMKQQTLNLMLVKSQIRIQELIDKQHEDTK